MTSTGPVQIADRIYWVGVRLADDRFQSHVYLIENGTDSVLIDPGSPLTIEATLRSVAQVVPISSIRWLVCHHPDPDVIAAIGPLSDVITRPDARLVTEWRAAALLKHYGHRFEYYLVEDHAWELPLGTDRRLEFQLTPYLHFPGAMVSFDPQTRTLFSGDIFGGFVPDNALLVSEDVDYIIENARPFHQHYMPSREMLEAGLNRIQRRWPSIARVAPQHGHVIDTPAVDDAFTALKGVECGVFALADADLDLQRLLRIAHARSQITAALLQATEPSTLLTELNRILQSTHTASEAMLFVDLPEQGWTMWSGGTFPSMRREPPEGWPRIELAGYPTALLALRTADDAEVDTDLLDMLAGMAEVVRPAVDQYLHERGQKRRVADLRTAALTDPLTGLRNRRALDEAVPTGRYGLIALDIDHFKRINDAYGHRAGDVVLAHLSRTLDATLRDGDRAYRVGGEEFLVVLPDTDETATLAVAERLRRAIRAVNFDGQAPGGQVTVSLGVTTCADATVDQFEPAVAVADQALYQAKESGRDRTCVVPAPVFTR